jgi:hypothetical protein
MRYEESRNAVPTTQRTKHLCYRDQPVSVVQWNCCCSLSKSCKKCTHMHTRACTHTVHKMQHSGMMQQLIHAGTAVLLRVNQFAVHWNSAKSWRNKDGSFVNFRKFVITCLCLQTKHYLYIIYIVARCDIMYFLFCSLRAEDSTLSPTGCLPTIRGHTSTTYWAKGISKLVLQICQRRLEYFLFKDQRGVCVCVWGGGARHSGIIGRGFTDPDNK